MELARKQMVTPTAAMITPATDGPTTAAPLKTDELRAIAFMRSCRPTISMTNAWRDGTSKRLMTPVAKAATITIQYCAWPVELSAKRTNEGTVNRDWVASSTLRFWNRSATTPPS